VFLNACCLIPNARLVHLRSDYLEQIDSIVNARSRETLNFLGYITALAGALRSKIRVGEFAPRSDSAGTRRLRLPTGPFLRACLRCGFLCAQSLRRLFLCKQPRVLGFALELCLAFLLFVLLAFARFGAVGPLVDLRAFLCDGVSINK
jgi:hypothetical protein